MHPLKLTKFSVPPAQAHWAHLVCQYDLEGGKLYDVKWYKDDHNFLRCNDEGVHTYPADGVNVYNTEPVTSSCSLTLSGLTAKSAGIYKCEVTLDAPSFPTVSSFGDLKVVPVEPTGMLFVQFFARRFLKAFKFV